MLPWVWASSVARKPEIQIPAQPKMLQVTGRAVFLRRKRYSPDLPYSFSSASRAMLLQ
jgi:hypothetical protein